MKATIFTTAVKSVLISSTLFIGACSKDNTVKDADPISSRFGEYVEIPGFNKNSNISRDLVATDNGLYITVGNIDNGDDWIHRYELAQDNILKGSWQKAQYNISSGNDYLNSKTPLNWKSELVSEHEIFITPTFYAFEKPVFRTINMANGSTISQENAPTHDFYYADRGSFGTIIKDDFGQDWAVFQGGTVSNANTHVVKIRYGKLPFNTVSTITAKGELYYSASLASSNLYALSYEEKKLFIIKPNGQVLYNTCSAQYCKSGNSA